VFRIVKYRNVSGKILITIETNDQTAADFLRFFGSANKFVELFHYRMRTAKGVDIYQKTAPARLALVEKEYSAQLKRFRELTGTRIQRLRMLKEIRESNGEKVTLDRIEAEIRSASKHEKDRHLMKIKELNEKGKSLQEITSLIDLPKSTVARYLRKLRTKEKIEKAVTADSEARTAPKGA
jgi:hypothetical protein